MVGLDGVFGIRTGRQWWRTDAAWIPAGVGHELDCGDTLMATLYLFPLSGGAETLPAALGLNPCRIAVDVAMPPALRLTLEAVHGGDHDRAATQQWLDAALIGPPRPAPPVDLRVQRVAALLREHASEGVALADLAAAVGISEPRLMHLFKDVVGVPVRRYRLWERMRLVTEHVASGESLTMAGLAAGFADSSHLSHGFRSMFGLAASGILNQHSRLRI